MARKANETVNETVETRDENLTKTMPDTDRNESTDLMPMDDSLMDEILGKTVRMPAILMFKERKAYPMNQVINAAAGDSVSISSILNKEVILEGFGAVKLEYVDQETGEFGDYVRYILITNEGIFTTTSTFIGRTLKMLYQVMLTSEPRVKFIQKEGTEGKRRFMMELL